MLLKEKINSLDIILASQSPRRSQLLRESGFTNIQIAPADVDETIPVGMPHFDVALHLAHKKAHHQKYLLRPNAIIIAADTVVIVPTKSGTQILNKPLDRTEAITMLQLLSGKKHHVVTGVCVLSLKKESGIRNQVSNSSLPDTRYLTPDSFEVDAFNAVTEVRFEKMTKAEIEFYVDNYKPYDKAGSYAVQEWIGHCKIKSIKGTYSNVMGLPMYDLYKVLEKFL